ncbi:non-heme iron oxygenase ferredoxin subunit [Nocardioides panacisoli]|uniref:non-heme iron oxygenase ferredoxin subunit n=1 Tax=Nocardioides panacisoli TaxID=627624 RepID=UPI001C636333|nr:non-heme iron oxygenase ferredoxin subunit [Nocardioides panacisoli]QYJ04985.1 non-heme iron oxygenase ferredoxin subunit [Nocardioides panacisoli]
MSFQRACAVADVPTDEAVAATIGAYEVAVARDGEEFFAVQNLCTHAAVELTDGEVEDGAIECFLHGSCFELRTGKPTQLPATEPVATFPVEIRRDDGVDQVYVDTTTTLNGVTPQ